MKTAALCIPPALAGCSTGAGRAGGTDSGVPPGTGDGGDSGPLDASVADQGSPDAPGASDGSPGASDDGGAEAGDAGDDGGPPAAPGWLSQTGLFTSVAATGALVLAANVQEYTPAYALWADGASKTRWILLPSGSKIDTTDMDHWKFPVGTKLFKEFDLEGQRLETRMIWHYGPGADHFLYRS